MKTIKITLTAFLLMLITGGVSAQNTSQTKVNIKDMLFLLPDDVFPEYTPSDRAGKESHISVCDYKNGYLSLSGAQYGWEMCYWNLKDGRKLIAVNNAGESGSIIRVFFWKNGNLTEDANYQFGGGQLYQLDDFVDISNLNKDELVQAELKFAAGDYLLYYQLPQKGTSIKVALDTFSFFDFVEEAPESKEIVFKWVNEKWVRQ